MKHFISGLAVCAGLVFTALPAGATVQTGSALHYSTSITQLHGASGPFTGALDLTVSADGIVNGYYFPADGSAMFVQVVGGRNADRVWLDIGTNPIIRVEGRLQNGNITGTAITSGNEPLAFAATRTLRSAR